VRIVYLHQYFVTPAMSGGTRSYEMARRLAAAGHEVHIVTGDQSAAPGGPRWRKTVEAGVYVHWASVPYSNEMGFVRRLLAFMHFALLASRQAIRLRGDVIFATSTPLTIAIPALIASTWTRRPYVFEVRDMWPDVPIAIGAIRNPLAVAAARALEMLAYRRAAHIVALAPGMAKDIAAKGTRARKLSVIPNGCDVDVFSEDATAARRLRDATPWLGDRRLVVFTGTLGLVNGVDYLARLAAAVAVRDPEVRFVVIGRGRDRERVQQVATDCGIFGRSFFMLGQLPKRDLVAWTSAADFTVALFTGPRVIWKDAVQNKFFDSLAAGRPVACNFQGWQSDIAEQEGVGITLPTTDFEAAADILLAHLRNQSWIQAARDRALSLAHGRFSRDNLSSDLERVLVAVANHSGPPRL
jgi:glycosyltransferase involved in cell wall biosynthesis